MSAATRAGERRMWMTGPGRGHETTPVVDAAAVWRMVDQEAGVGALRRVRSGGRVLMRGIEGGVLEATVQRETAPRGGDRWRDGEAAVV